MKLLETTTKRARSRRLMGFAGSCAWLAFAGAAAAQDEFAEEEMVEAVVAAAEAEAAQSLPAGEGTAAEDEALRLVLAQDLETMTVYATRSPSRAFDYPGQVTVLDRDAILDFNPSTLQDVFDAIPGAQFNSGARRSGDAPNIRGIGSAGVLIFLDGARQSFLSGHDGRFFVDPELVQAVEVVRGPTSALYGSGALGGVIATRTITAADMLDAGEVVGARLNGGYQSVNGEYRVGGTAAFRSEGGLVDGIGHLTFRDSGDIELGNDVTLPADDEILSSLAKLTLRPADGLELYASYLRYELDATDPQNPQGVNLAGPDNDLVFRDAVNETVQGGVGWNPASALIDFKAVGYYSDNAVEEDSVDDPRTTDRRVETLGFTIDNRSRFTLGRAASLTLTYGGEYYRDEQTGRDTETPDGSRGGVPDAETDFFGLFIQAEWTLRDLGPVPGEFTLIPGVRWDSFETSSDDGSFTIDEDEVSPKVGFSYKPIPQILIFGNYAQGFRAPNFNEAFADGVHFTIPNLPAAGPFGPPPLVQNDFIGNDALTPEDSRTFEIGAGLDLESVLFEGDVFNLKASYYDSNVEDLIGLDVSTPLGCFFTPETAPPGLPPFLVASQPCGSGAAFGNTSQNVNIQNAEIEGVEAEFNYDAERFFLRGNVATIDGRDADTGEFLEGNLFPTTAFLDGGLKFPSWGLRVGSRLRIAAAFDEVNEVQDSRQGYVVGDIYAVWTPPIDALDGVRLDLGVDNVADVDYEVVFAGARQPGRNFKVAVSWSKGF